MMQWLCADYSKQKSFFLKVKEQFMLIMLVRAKEDKELSGMIKDKHSKYLGYIYENQI